MCQRDGYQTHPLLKVHPVRVQYGSTENMALIPVPVSPPVTTTTELKVL